MPGRVPIGVGGMRPGATVTWTDRAGVDHPATVTLPNDRRVPQAGRPVDGVFTFVAELVDFPGQFVEVRIERCQARP